MCEEAMDTQQYDDCDRSEVWNMRIYGSLNFVIIPNLDTQRESIEGRNIPRGIASIVITTVGYAFITFLPKVLLCRLITVQGTRGLCV